jgi:hypothetical protein
MVKSVVREVRERTICGWTNITGKNVAVSGTLLHPPGSWVYICGQSCLSCRSMVPRGSIAQAGEVLAGLLQQRRLILGGLSAAHARGGCHIT